MSNITQKMSEIPGLLDELEVALENTYLDPNVRVWMTRVVNALKEEGWTPTTKPQPQKSEPGPEPTTSPLDDEDTSPSTSSKGTTKPTQSVPSGTDTPSEG